jgi:molybdate-binding protein/DNA-binding XRE family transcriptional regulator
LPEIENTLGTLRQKRGLSAIQLAKLVGVSRQTVYAIEAGTYVPNTTIALKLARALDTTVDSLFALATDAPPPELRTEQALLLPGSETPQSGQAVQLCHVDRKLVASAPSALPWYFPASDAIVSENGAREGKTNVQVFHPDEEFAHRILVAGCDPGISVLARHVQAAGIELVLAHRNSSQSLALLREGCIHIAGTHLRDDASGESNIPEIAKLFADNSVAVITFAVWEEGIVTARNNPRNIKGIEDLARSDVTLVNREKGAGSRSLLDTHLKRAKIEPKKIRGYSQPTAPGHLPAAWRVLSGDGDCCIATRAAARTFGLGFVPLVSERYDLAIRRHHLELPGIQALFDTLSRLNFRRELERLGGYDTSGAGRRLL